MRLVVLVQGHRVRSIKLLATDLILRTVGTEVVIGVGRMLYFITPRHASLAAPETWCCTTAGRLTLGDVSDKACEVGGDGFEVIVCPIRVSQCPLDSFDRDDQRPTFWS
jgi:hypothetical protein